MLFFRKRIEAVITGPIAESGRATKLGQERCERLITLATSAKARFDVTRDFSRATISATTLRKLILDDADFRRGLRTLEGSVEEVHLTRSSIRREVFRTIEKYIAYVKRYGLESQATVPFADNFERWKARLEDWGGFKMNATVIVGIAAILISLSSWLAFKASSFVRAYADETTEMLESAEGLQRAIERRSGISRSTTQPSTQTAR